MILQHTSIKKPINPLELLLFLLFIIKSLTSYSSLKVTSC